MPLKIHPLPNGARPVILLDMDALCQLVQLFRAGWSLQVAPEPGAWGHIYATVVWSRQRSEIEQTIDGAAASLPVLDRVELTDASSFSEMVARMYVRVFPISPAA